MRSSLRWIVVFLGFLSFSVLTSSNSNCEQILSTENNPFLDGDMFDDLDFSKIRLSHYIPALDKGIEEANEVINKIVTNKEESTFENTILPLEYGFKILTRVNSVFFNLTSTISSKELVEVEEVFRKKVSDFNNALSFNKELFKKIEMLYNKKDSLNLSSEALRVLELQYKGYIVEGINLSEDKQDRIKVINSKLSTLYTKFKNNLLEDTHNKYIFLENNDRLSGVPKSIQDSFKQVAKTRNMEGYLIGASRVDTLNILSTADDRDLRRQAMELYTSIGENNIDIAREIINYRVELSSIFEKPNYATYIIENYSMADSTEEVLNFVDNIWDKALKKAKDERENLENFARLELNDLNFKLEAWDWFYWSEKLKSKICDLDINEVNKYFELSNVKQGLFTVLAKLYDLEFIKIDKKAYHEDVDVYRVQNIKTKKYIGDLYLDYFARSGKKAGAWTSRFRSQSLSQDGTTNITPIVVVVYNFLKSTNKEPVLLSRDDVETFFHEMGHAVHGLVLNCRYPSLASGYTRDFVELPSQILEKWAFHKDVLPLYARNYQTGELISNELIDKMEKLDTYGSGFTKTEYLAAAILDLKLHLRSEEFKNNLEVQNFEKQVLDSYGLIPEIIVRYKTAYFQHIFVGGYYSRYYSYLWSEVLVSDAFSFFQKEGVFNRRVADSFKNNVLSRGNSEESSVLYERFSGHKNPSIEALLKDLGFEN